MIRLAFHVLVAIAWSACVAARRAPLAEPQDIRPPTDDAANPAALGEGPKPELSDEARETIGLVRSALQANDPEGARKLLQEAVAALEDPEPDQEPSSRLAGLLELDRLAEELGCLEESQHLRESVLELLPADHPDILNAKENLAWTRQMLGDLAGARALQEEVLGARTRLLPPDHADLLWAKGNLAVTRKKLGDLAGALALEEEVLEARTRLLPPDHPDLLMAKLNLAGTRARLGDLQGGRALGEEVLEAWTRILPPDHPDLIKAKLNLAATRSELGDLAGARVLLEEAVAVWERLLPTDHPDLIAAKMNLAGTKNELGDLAGANELFEAVHEAWLRLLPPDHPDLLRAKLNLAGTRGALGDLAGAHELEEAVHEVWTHLLPPDHPDLLLAKQSLAVTRSALGDIPGAHALFEEVLEAHACILPSDHPDLLTAKANLATTKSLLGDLAGARALEQEVLEARTRILPPDHPDLLAAKENLATTKHTCGDIAGARALEEEVLEGRTRILPADHPDLLLTKQNLAIMRSVSGDLAGGLELGEEVLAARTRLLPPDHPDLLATKGNLALTRHRLGDLAGARALQEEVLVAWTRLLPPDHPHLLVAKENLAGTRFSLGDLAGARMLYEEVVLARLRALPADHPDLLRAKLNLATMKSALGDDAGAREIEEEVFTKWTRLLPAEHPHLLAAKANLALTRNSTGDPAGARQLLEEVLMTRSKLHPPEHPDLLKTKQDLATVEKVLGNLTAARDLEEEVLAAQVRLLPPEHPAILRAEQNLAMTKAALGDLAGARELVSSLLAGMRQRARALRSEAARPARESARRELQRLSAALILTAWADPEQTLSPELFATLESLRAASVASAAAAQALAARPELANEARGSAALRSRLNDLVASGPVEGTSDEWRRSLLELTEERDRAERRLRVRLAEAGAFVGEVDADAVADGLAPGSAAVSFLRRETGKVPSSEDCLLAFVVQPGGPVTRVELGPATELTERVGAWRAALGRPLAGRGIVGSDEVRDEETFDGLGAELRARILDPILAVTGEVRALHVVLDDVLFLVPLDALPLEDGLVGERIAIRNEVTLAQLLHKPSPIPAGGRLVLAGGLDYDAELGGEAVARLDAATPPVGDSLERSGTSRTSFAFLPGATAELESIAALYEGTFDDEITTLMGAGGTKSALVAHAPGARWLHLATHGWFASESFKSQLDSLAEQSARDAFQRAEATLTGFAPETLCGLALSGANRGRDALGRVPGILTAEELATFDLRNCELAVLSACETNVGIRRAGQGIQSLQTALHAAGARTAITSLWKVDDAATRRLFELFYTKLWRDELGKHDALWQAKLALRAEGHPPRDWAAWVLSGDPD